MLVVSRSVSKACVYMIEACTFNEQGPSHPEIELYPFDEQAAERSSFRFYVR